MNDADVEKLRKKLEKDRKFCIACGNEIYECEECRNEFKDGDKIICFGGKAHLCFQDCLDAYIRDMAVESSATSKK